MNHKYMSIEVREWGRTKEVTIRNANWTSCRACGGVERTRFIQPNSFGHGQSIFVECACGNRMSAYTRKGVREIEREEEYAGPDQIYLPPD